LLFRDWIGKHPTNKETTYGLSFYSITKGTDVAWMFAREWSELLEIEELFVAPSYRNRGLGSELIEFGKTLSNNIGKPFRFWLSHGDRTALGRDLHDIAFKWKLEVRESPNRMRSKILVKS
jgi:GNAT superfamily N-acetyltransferase